MPTKTKETTPETKSKKGQTFSYDVTAEVKAEQADALDHEPNKSYVRHMAVSQGFSPLEDAEVSFDGADDVEGRRRPHAVLHYSVPVEEREAPSDTESHRV